MSNLRPFQSTIQNDTYKAWKDGAKVVMPVLPTGGGKTRIMGKIGYDFDGIGVAIAHRMELVTQISIAFAKEGIYHDLITPKSSPLRRMVSDAHLREIGKNYVNERGRWKVGGVDTIVKYPFDDKYLKTVGMVFQDEGHHVLKANKWGRAFDLFPNAYGLFPTATPRRADGLGLGIDTHGLVDVMVEGPSMRELIQMGYLTDYQLACPTVSDLDLTGVEVSAATGDYNQDQVRKAVRKSKKIVGDVVHHYLKLARGKLGITFAVDVEEATKIAEAFRQAGVPAEVVSAKTPDDLRRDILRRFAAREILQLVNVDLFGEGFDLPAIEVVSMARPTMSFALFYQQFGRALRLMLPDHLQSVWGTFTDAERLQLIKESVKPFALIIDHVGNIIEHNYPDKPQMWSLDPRSRRNKGEPNDAIPLRACVNTMCNKVYERSEICCPYCGTEPPLPGGRSQPKFVDGDLLLLDQETLAKLRGDVEHVDKSAFIPKGVPAYAHGNIIANHAAIQNEQNRLRHTIAQWAGNNAGYSERVLHKRFYLTYGLTVLEAKALNKRDAEILNEKILLTM